MKKVLLVGALAISLAGCSENEEGLAEVKKQNKQLQVQVEELTMQIAVLTDQVEALANAKEGGKEQVDMQAFTIQTLSSDGISYTKAEVTVRPKGEENEYEAMLRTIFPELTFNDVAIDTDATITIDVNENSTGSPNMTSSAQVGVFFDQLTYALTENFPELKGYYLTSNGETTYMGDSGPYEGLQQLSPLTEEELYLPINE